MKNVFSKFDVDGSGSIDMDEIASLMDEARAARRAFAVTSGDPPRDACA